MGRNLPLALLDFTGPGTVGPAFFVLPVNGLRSGRKKPNEICPDRMMMQKSSHYFSESAAVTHQQIVLMLTFYLTKAQVSQERFLPSGPSVCLQSLLKSPQ